MSVQMWQETIAVAQTDGAAVTAAAATSLLPTHAKATLPPLFFDRAGKRIRIKASGKISSLITTPGTARFDVRLGATVVFDGLAVLLDSVAAHTDVGWSLEIELTQRALGAVATLIGIGKWTCEDILGVPAAAPKGVLTAVLPWNSAPAAGNTFDATATQVLDLYFTQTAATGSITLQQYSVESLN